MSPEAVVIECLKLLPTEVLIETLSYLPKENLIKLIKAEPWLGPISVDVLWKKTNVSDLMEIEEESYFQTVANVVETLELSSNWSRSKSKRFHRVLGHKQWPRLRHVYQAHAEDGSYYAAFFKNLASAGMPLSSDSDSGEENIAGVTSIEFVCWTVGHQEFAKVLREFKSLQKLECKFGKNRHPLCWPVGDGAFDEPQFAWPKLETAIIRWGDQPSPESLLITLRRSLHLKTLDVRVDTAEAVQCVGSMKSLTHLRLEIGSPAIRALAELGPISELHQLESLEILQSESKALERDSSLTAGNSVIRNDELGIISLVCHMRSLEKFDCSTMGWEIQDERKLSTRLEFSHRYLSASSVRLALQE